MGFFEGFLSGFSQVGSELIQQEDTRKQRANEIVQQADEQIRINNARIDKEAKSQLEARKELLQQQKELLYGVNPLQATGPTEPVMPMEPEINLETGQPVTSTFTGITQPTTSTIPREYFEPYLGDEDMLQKGMRDYKADMKSQMALQSAEDRANARANATIEAATIKTEAARAADTMAAWDNARSNKDSDVSQTLQAAGTFPVVKEQIEQYRQASRDLGIDSALGSIVSGFLKNSTLDAKLLEEAGVTAAVANAKDLKPVSNDEIKMLKEIAPNPNNVNAYNQFLFTILEYKAARAAQKADFYLAAKEKGLRPLDAELKYNKWEREYIKQNPYFSKTTSGKMGFAPGITPDSIANDDSWKTVLGLTPVSKPEATSITSNSSSQTQKSNSSEGYTSGYKSFDDLYKDVQGE